MIACNKHGIARDATACCIQTIAAVSLTQMTPTVGAALVMGVLGSKDAASNVILWLADVLYKPH